MALAADRDWTRVRSPYEPISAAVDGSRRFGGRGSGGRRLFSCGTADASPGSGAPAAVAGTGRWFRRVCACLPDREQTPSRGRSAPAIRSSDILWTGVFAHAVEPERVRELGGVLGCTAARRA